MLQNKNYDIIVVGAGPAGSMTALTAARNGVRVLLLEKDREIGVPVRCAEGVGKESLEKILEMPVRPEWIAAEIKRFRFIAPDDTEVFPKINMTGYVLNRKIFDFNLAQMAAAAGCDIITRANVTGLINNRSAICGVIATIANQPVEIRTKIVIGADGVETRTGRWAGLDTTIPMKDMETCSQVTLQHDSLAPDECSFYFSQKEFPGGYAWVFPKGQGLANVGLGIAGNLVRRSSADERLQRFIARYFPAASVLGHTVGGVPCANRPAKLTADGFMLVGDAAFQSNPMTGGGITSGMTGAKLAGNIAAEAVKTNELHTNFLRKYEQEWDKAGGANQRIYYRIKKAIKKLSDEQLNRTAHNVASIPREKQTLLKIFQTALIQQPGLMVDLIRLLSPFN